MAADRLAEVASFGSAAAFAIPAVKLLILQRRISKASKIADDGSSQGSRLLAADLRDQYKEGVFGFSPVDAGCVAVGLLLLVISTWMKL